MFSVGRKITISTEESKQEYSKFAELIAYAVIVTVRGKNVFCNREGAALLGLSNSKKISGSLISDFFSINHVEYFDMLSNTTIPSNGANPPIELKTTRADGTHIDLEIAATTFNYFGEDAVFSIIKDITASNNTKKELQEKEQQLLEITDNVFDMVGKTTIDGIITYASPSHKDILGYDSSELIGRSIFETVHPDDLEYIIKESKAETVNSNKSVRKGVVLRSRCADGHYIWTEVASKLIFDNDGNASGAIFYSRDISERKQAEELRQKMEKYTKELNESIEYEKIRTEFFSNISHEFKTPLNVMFAALQMTNIILDGAENSKCKEDVKKYTNLMKQNCYRLIRLVNNLIDITRIDSGYYKVETANYNIVNIVENTTLSVSDYIGNKGIKLIFDTNCEEIITSCDPDKIERIMLNLLSNALKFTESGGSIQVNVLKKGRKMYISVKDTGSGIPLGKEKYIFDRFVQVDKSLTRNHEGSGIGLSLVKSLVEMHRGTIEVISQLGQGSEFIIELPIKKIKTANESNEQIIDRQSNIEKIDIEFSDIYF